MPAPSESVPIGGLSFVILMSMAVMAGKVVSSLAEMFLASFSRSFTWTCGFFLYNLINRRIVEGVIDIITFHSLLERIVHAYVDDDVVADDALLLHDAYGRMEPEPFEENGMSALFSHHQSLFIFLQCTFHTVLPCVDALVFQLQGADELYDVVDRHAVTEHTRDELGVVPVFRLNFSLRPSTVVL